MATKVTKATAANKKAGGKKANPKKANPKKANPATTKAPAPKVDPTPTPNGERTLKPGQALVKRFRDGTTMTATVQPDLTIKFDGTVYGSPSGVASAMIAKHDPKATTAVNGWSFFSLIARTDADPVGSFTKAAESLFARAERLATSNDGPSIKAVADLAKRLGKLLAP